jgi:hypothetical protein
MQGTLYGIGSDPMEDRLESGVVLMTPRLSPASVHSRTHPLPPEANTDELEFTVGRTKSHQTVYSSFLHALVHYISHHFSVFPQLHARPSSFVS